jgi:flagellar biosynthesis protein FlhA
MPGKQMAIDADLNAGLIDEKEAKRRREEIAREAEFYGAMDGASKFVRGEAIAGLIIMAINVIGGFIIGVLQQDMNIGAAAVSYTLLTIGDGLVSQIPALIISTAAGILVSRAASSQSMGGEFMSQFAGHPQALAVTACIVFAFGLVPGLPTMPFTFLSAGIGTLAWFAFKNMRIAAKRPEDTEEAAEQPESEAGPQEDVEKLLSMDILELEVGYGLIPLVDEEQGGDLLERIKSIRRQFAKELGVIVPPLHVRDNLQLNPGQYNILIKGIEVATGELMIGHLLAMDPGDAHGEIEGIPTTEPAFGLPAWWIPEEDRSKAQVAGYTVVDLSTVVATHLAEVIKRELDELLGRQETQRLLDALAKTQPKAVEEVNNALPLGVIQKVLQQLIREGISIRDLLTICETLADYANMTKDPEILTEYVRQKLGRAIVKPLLDENGQLAVITLYPEVEEKIRSGLQQTEHGSFLALDPATAQRIVQSIKEAVDKVVKMGKQPVILTNPAIRRHLRKLVERFMPEVTVLSHSEIPGNVKLDSIASVK